MTVKELRDLLAQFPDDMRVVVNGYEYGCIDALPPVKKRLYLNANRYHGYGGPHEVMDSEADERGAIETANDLSYPTPVFVEAVLLPRMGE